MVQSVVVDHVDVPAPLRIAAARDESRRSAYTWGCRAPERYAVPHVVDLRRESGGASTWPSGHGENRCLGAQLAVEMRVAFSALLECVPTLRMAVRAEEVVLRPETRDTYGVRYLPVAWDA
ncbi:hypothetical protein [Streptomyces sp. NRRL S-448]|uniref:hypothetical protein n=1 Tax=Streptomyces sp. NRRL S-448 TaxID=1463907 RepID=UPI003562FD4D